MMTTTMAITPLLTSPRTETGSSCTPVCSSAKTSAPAATIAPPNATSFIKYSGDPVAQPCLNYTGGGGLRLELDLSSV
jgi:hypothetical protein